MAPKNQPSLVVLSSVENNHATLDDLFLRAGWRVRHTRSLADLDSDPDASVGVVLTDYKLPDGRWTRVLEHARRRAPGTEVVVYSDLVDEHLWAEVLCLGGFDVVGQPFDEQELLRVTASAWLESQVQRELIANNQ